MNKTTVLTCLLICSLMPLVYGQSQGVSISTDGSQPNPNAIIDIKSPPTGNGKGMLIPRVTLAQRTTSNVTLAGGLLDNSGNLRGGAAQGLMVYQTDGAQGFYYNNSATSTPNWIQIGASGVTSITTGTGLTGGTITSNGTIALGNLGTPGTYTKVSVDAQGRVSSGTLLADTDVPALPISKITNLQTELDKIFKWTEVTGTSITAVGNNGYLANNASLVTITLPSAPALGDIIKVTGVGSGGWKIAQNAGQSIVIGRVGDLGWGVLDPDQTFASKSWYGCRASTDGSKIVAIAQNDYIYTSSDSGNTWTKREAAGPGVIENWQSVDMSADGSKIIVAEYDNDVYYSTDSGVTWSILSALPGIQWQHVRVSDDGTKMVASDGSSVQVSSDSGASWANVAPTTAFWQDIEISGDGSTIAVCGNTNYVYYSSNFGGSWNSYDPTGSLATMNWQGVSLSKDGSKIIACASGDYVYTSMDSGASWTKSTQLGSNSWRSCAISENGSGMIAISSISSDPVFVSDNGGVNWRPETVPAASRQSASISGNGKTGYVAVLSYDGILFGPIGKETTVGTAGSVDGYQYSTTQLQYVGGGKFISISTGGFVQFK